MSEIVDVLREAGAARELSHEQEERDHGEVRAGDDRCRFVRRKGQSGREPDESRIAGDPCDPHRDADRNVQDDQHQHADQSQDPYRDRLHRGLLDVGGIGKPHRGGCGRVRIQDGPL
jgi:CRISPR/Cas system-associated protein Cas10 (large subunit of type III CRISPR-Cas system)